MGSRYKETCDRLRARHGDKFVAPTAMQFANAMDIGEHGQYRIKVRTTYPSGEKFERWGFVAMTTGWRPAFILMRNRRCIGSSDVLNDKDEIIDRKWIK